MTMLSVLGVLLLGRMAAAKRPNILFVISDDQDLLLAPPAQFMPQLKIWFNNLEAVIDRGATLATHFCTTAVCCPSRATLWTGRLAHNTNVTDVEPPYGGYPKVASAGWNDDNLFLWMQSAGYNTYYTGKLWNAHTTDNYDAPYVRGFNGSDLLLDPFTYNYFNPALTRDGAAPQEYAGEYSTDLIAQRAHGYVAEAVSHDQPWFLTVAPIAPHGEVKYEPTTKTQWTGPPQPAPRHQHLFSHEQVPRDPSFNVPIPGAPSWVGRLQPLNATQVEQQDEPYRLRLRALQAVDEMVGALVRQLDAAGVLDETYIVYTTDNGFHITQHAMKAGKGCGYDTDTHIPLYIRGPNIAAGSVIDAVTSHTDLSPTILQIAGVRLNSSFDGRPIPLNNVEMAKLPATEHIAIEFWGMALGGIGSGWLNGTGHLDMSIYTNNTYKAVRIASTDYSVYYSVWCTNETELYDFKRDPYQTTNLLAHEGSDSDNSLRIANRPQEQIVNRLDTLVMGYLHPAGGVIGLAEALAPQFDSFYGQQIRVSFGWCDLGYLPAAEGPQQAKPYSDQDQGDHCDGYPLVSASPRKKRIAFDYDYRGNYLAWT